MGSIREYLLSCPLLDSDTLRINYLGDDPLEYTLEDVPSEVIVKRYVDGSSVRQALFLFASRELYSRSAIENLKACGFYEQLAQWMEDNTNRGVFPVLPPGMTAQWIGATTNGFCLSADVNQKKQRYQIQCKLLYLKD